MATYLPGVQDKVERVRPPQPNLQFESQMLSARQSKYDQGHKQLSDMYGKILNSGLTRESNVKARDDFFKLIDNDLKKIAGIDLSKQSNVTKAQNVFSQVYDNDFLVKDMVWTKNYQNEMQKAEQYKNCIDPKECGGAYWDEGMKHMQYKKQEFAETDNADSLNFQNAEFVPYQNIMEDAMVAAKDSGLSITYDEIIGNYKVTTKNGRAIVNPLTELFKKLYKDNPGYQKQFEVESYNERKDWATSRIQSGEFGSMQEAEVGYIKQQSERLTQAVNAISADIGADNTLLDSQVLALTKKMNQGKIPEGSSEYNRLIELSQLKELSDQAKHFSDISQTALKNANNHGVVRNIGAQLDKASGLVKLDREIKETAGILSHVGEEHTMEADDFAVMRVKHGYDAAMEGMRQRGRLQLEGVKQAGRLELKGLEENLPIANIQKIDKDFKKINGSANLLKDFQNEAKAKFPTLTADEISDITNDKNLDNKDRKKALNKNKDQVEKQNNYIAEQQAKMLDQQTKGTTYTDALAAGENELWKGTTVPTTSSVDYSGGGYSGGGGGTLAPLGGTRAPVGGTPAPRKPTMRDVDYSKLSKEDVAELDSMIEFVAENVADDNAKKFYEAVAKKGFSNSSPKSQALVLEKIGGRWEQIKTKSENRPHWESGASFTADTTKVGSAKKEFKKVIKPALAQKLESGQNIARNYINTIKPGSDEEESLRQYMQRYMVQHGDIDVQGTLTYNGQEIGSLYNPLSGPFEGDSNRVRGYSNEGRDIPKDSYGRKKWHLHPNVLSNELSLDNMKKLLAKNKYMSSAIAQYRVIDRVDESQGAYFKNKMPNSERTQYENDVASYQQNSETYSSMHESRKLAHDDIISSMNASDVFADHDTWDADQFVINGNFVWPKNTVLPDDQKAIHAAYADAMDAAYAEGNLNAYVVGAGTRMRKDMNAFNVDMKDLGVGSIAMDIRNYVNIARNSSSEADVQGLGITKTGDWGDLSNTEILNSIFEGEVDIVKASFNPLRGKNPYGLVGEMINPDAADQDWSRLTVQTTDGRSINIDLNNTSGMNEQSTLLLNSMNTQKANALNVIGTYDYQFPKRQEHLTNNEPITIQRRSQTQLGVEGSLWVWDEVAELGTYVDIQKDLFDANMLPHYESPEQLELILDALIDQSDADYKKYIKPATL